jgi:hypothetical protein
VTPQRGENRQREEQMLQKRDSLLQQAAEQFPDQAEEQRRWALGKWSEIYPTCPPLLRWRIYDQALRSLGEGELSPSLRQSSSPPVNIIQAREGAEAARTAFAKAESSGSDTTATRKSAGRDERKRREQELSNERDSLFQQAQEHFFDDPAAQSEWACDQWVTRHPQCPPLVDKKLFGRLLQSLARSRFRKAIAGRVQAHPQEKEIIEKVQPSESKRLELEQSPSMIERQPDKEVANRTELTESGQFGHLEPVLADEPEFAGGTLIRIPPAANLGRKTEDLTGRTGDAKSPPRSRGGRRFSPGNSGPLPKLQGMQLKLSVGPGAKNKTLPGMRITYLVHAQVEFFAREPKATVHALPGSIVHSEGSRVIRFPGAIVYGACEESAEDEQAAEGEDVGGTE